MRNDHSPSQTSELISRGKLDGEQLVMFDDDHPMVRGGVHMSNQSGPRPRAISVLSEKTGHSITPPDHDHWAWRRQSHNHGEPEVEFELLLLFTPNRPCIRGLSRTPQP